MDRINAEYGVPSVIHALDGTTIAGRRVVVDGFCPPSRVGVMDPRIGQLSKLAVRARELGTRAAAYVAAGVPSRQIIVSGHSSGGWAALMVERERPDVVGGAMAFAPAAFGTAAGRPPLTVQVRRTRYAELRSAARLRALIFGFAGDDFESADDLRVLARVPGASFVAIPEPGPAGRRCALPPHARVRDPCFGETQGPRIRAFIAARVGGAGAQ
jgi:pimeloyl-ACP methyl ester carboxylesterase